MSHTFFTPYTRLMIGQYSPQPYIPKPGIQIRLNHRWRNYIISQDEFMHPVSDRRLRIGNDLVMMPLRYPNCCLNCTREYQYRWGLVSLIVWTLNFCLIFIVLFVWGI